MAIFKGGAIAPKSRYQNAKARDIKKVGGSYMLNGTMVANEEWRPEVGEQVQEVGPGGRPQKTYPYTGDAEKKKPSLLDVVKAAASRK